MIFNTRDYKKGPESGCNFVRGMTILVMCLVNQGDNTMARTLTHWRIFILSRILEVLEIQQKKNKCYIL